MSEDFFASFNELVREEEDLYDPEEIEKMKANGTAAAQRLFMILINEINNITKDRCATEAAAFLNEMLRIISQILPQDRIDEFEQLARNCIINGAEAE